MDFASSLRTMRAVRNLSQLELAGLTGIPNTYISDMERGKVLPSADWETRIRKALDWTPATDAMLANIAKAECAA